MQLALQPACILNTEWAQLYNLHLCCLTILDTGVINKTGSQPYVSLFKNRVNILGSSALHNVDFNGVRFDPLGSRSPPHECIKFGYPLENERFVLLLTNIAQEWLQIDTDLLLIITCTADELLGGTNIDDLERPWTPKIWVLSDFLLF